MSEQFGREFHDAKNAEFGEIRESNPILALNALITEEAQKNPGLFSDTSGNIDIFRSILAKFSKEDKEEIWKEYKDRPDARFSGETLVVLSTLLHKAQQSGFRIQS